MTRIFIVFLKGDLGWRGALTPCFGGFPESAGVERLYRSRCRDPDRAPSLNYNGIEGTEFQNLSETVGRSDLSLGWPRVSEPTPLEISDFNH